MKTSTIVGIVVVIVVFLVSVIAYISSWIPDNKNKPEEDEG